MLILSTKLIVNEKLTKEVFIQMVVDWLSGNRNYNFGEIVYDGTPVFSLQRENDYLEIADYPEALTVRLTSMSEGVIWTNDYVLTCWENNKVLAIQLYSDTENMSTRMPDKFNTPRILRQVVANGYGGMDCNLPVSATPCIITESNIEIAQSLVLHKCEYFMPVIYVSYPRYAIDKPVDFEAMAKDLSGVAHVVVESKEIASSVRQLTNECNPYAGAVEIFYGRHSSYRVLPDNYSSLDKMKNFIENSVYQKILMTRIDDPFSWMKIHFAHLQAENRQAPELIAVYKQLLKDAEADGDLKKDHIDELEYHIMELEEQIKDLNSVISKKDGQLQTFQHKFKQNGQYMPADGLKLTFSEKELYESEIKDVILKTLEKEKKQMDSDSNLIMSRKFHVLDNLLKLNQQTGKDSEISDCLRQVIDKSCRLNNQKRRQLSEAGFDIEEGSHYKITFNGDDRYSFTLSKTAGDYRSNTNTLKDAVNTLFGR